MSYLPRTMSGLQTGCPYRAKRIIMRTTCLSTNHNSVGDYCLLSSCQAPVGALLKNTFPNRIKNATSLQTDFVFRDMKFIRTKSYNTENLLVGQQLGFNVGKLFGISKIFTLLQFMYVLMDGDQYILNEFYESILH